MTPVTSSLSTIIEIIIGSSALLLVLASTYFLARMFLPRHQGYHLSQHIAVAIGLLVILLGFIELGLSYTPWKISFWPLVITLVVVSLVSFVITILGNSQEYIKRQAGSVQVAAIVRKITRSWRVLPSKDRYSWLFLGFAIVISLVLAPILIDIGNRRTAFTEFFIDLRAFPEAIPWQETLTPGDQVNIPVTVISYEVWPENYYIQVLINNQLYQGANLDDLQPEQKVTVIVPFFADQSGLYKVEFYLYKGESSDPYRSLHIWLDVSSK